MELNNLLVLVYIIINSTQYWNKVLLFKFITALILTRGGFITEVIQARIQDYHFTTNKRTIRDFVTVNLPWRIRKNNFVPVTTGVTQMVTSEYLRL